MGAVQAVVNRVRKARRLLPNQARRVSDAVYYRLRGSAPGTALLKAAAFARSPRDMQERRRLAARYNAAVRRSVMDPSKGYGLTSPDAFAGIEPVLAECRALFERKRAEVDQHNAAVASQSERQSSVLTEKRRFLQNLLTNDDLREHPALVDFALSDAALGLATNYLGTIPHLNRVDLLYSVPRESDSRISSQLFHVDPEGLTQVKLFVNVFDVGDAEGPFTFIPADDSARILREVRALRRRLGQPHVGRYTDEEVAAVGGTSAIVSVTGPRGAGVAVDTSRCLHLGSRVQPGAFRLCLYIQYCTSREQSNAFDVERYKGDPVRYLAVNHSAAWAGTDMTAPHQMGS
jgi:hypothetical protein